MKRAYNLPKSKDPSDDTDFQNCVLYQGAVDVKSASGDGVDTISSPVVSHILGERVLVGFTMDAEMTIAVVSGDRFSHIL